MIVEDDEQSGSELTRMIEASPYASEIESITFVHDAAGGFEAIHAGCDILFVAVVLGSERATGIDLVDALLSKCRDIQVVYMSSHLEYASDLYRTDHAWFLAKPIDQAKLEAALERVFENLKEGRCAPLLVRNNGSLVQVVPERIVYVESDRRKVRIHEDERVVETYAKLGDIEHSLPLQFIRCHKSFLVNMDCIRELHSNEVLMSNGEKVPVSQRCRKMLHDAFVDHVGRLL